MIRLLQTTVAAIALTANQGSTDNLKTHNLMPKVSTAACKAVGGGVEKDGTCGFSGKDGSYFIAKETKEGCNLELAAPTTGFKQYIGISCAEILQKVGSLRKDSKA